MVVITQRVQALVSAMRTAPRSQLGRIVFGIGRDAAEQQVRAEALAPAVPGPRARQGHRSMPATAPAMDSHRKTASARRVRRSSRGWKAPPPRIEAHQSQRPAQPVGKKAGRLVAGVEGGAARAPHLHSRARLRAPARRPALLPADCTSEACRPQWRSAEQCQPRFLALGDEPAGRIDDHPLAIVLQTVGPSRAFAGDAAADFTG